MNLGRIFNFIQPFLQLGSAPWNELWQIISEAHWLAVDTLCATIEVSHTFPKVGEPFNPSSMVNCDPIITGPPHVLAQQHRLVKIGITPIVVQRDMSSLMMATQTLHQGRVLLLR